MADEPFVKCRASVLRAPAFLGYDNATPQRKQSGIRRIGYVASEGDAVAAGPPFRRARSSSSSPLFFLNPVLFCSIQDLAQKARHRTSTAAAERLRRP
jgi:hypothetical protein